MMTTDRLLHREVKDMKKKSNSLETHINKGLTKHQAVNAVEGAGAVTAPAPSKKGKKKKGKTSFGPVAK